MNDRDRELAAARQRRHRLRKRCGLRPITIEVEEWVFEALHADGILSSEDLKNRHLLAETLGYFFCEFIALRRDVE
ncbi:hypothetical protein SAMN05444000_1067 [Shimia gijangensis]|uniref:Uncharacterized protein n=1 Tax=Shimia gijangensis TaxID=1470563 RepID=A0A1M6HBQ3_9RHOB|nr:hypothetical protein [Shimia gijangensis]SHJ19625.1 hypothetical protein SAMN05444000_1067 [Shimia gijangensis]